jgi:hypothetical protein
MNTVLAFEAHGLSVTVVAKRHRTICVLRRLFAYRYTLGQHRSQFGTKALSEVANLAVEPLTRIP